MKTWLAKAWATHATLNEIEVEGAVVRYRGWGLDVAERPGLMFVHGFMAHAHWWDHIAPHFMDRYRIVAPDLTGMGDSDWRDVYSRRQLARELIAVAAHAGLDRFILVAHSFGGTVAVRACEFAPDRIARAIIIDSDIFRDVLKGSEPTRAPKRFYPTREAALARYVLAPVGGAPVPEAFAYVGEHSIIQTEQGWTWKFDTGFFSALREPPVRDDLRKLEMPIDYVYGDSSQLVGAREIDELVKNTPTGGAPVKIPLCHHHVMLDQPVALVAALEGLLANSR